MTTEDHNEPSLIRTKLAPPKEGNAQVSRDLLLEQLDARRDRKLTVIMGPAGCGKTTLLTQWRKKLFLQGAKVAWYNAGADDDGAHVAAYIVEGLRQAGVSIETEELHLYQRSGVKISGPLLTSLINAVAAHDGEIYLMIDDFHEISSFETLRVIDRLIDLLPPCVHLVVSSRLRPPLQLGRLRAEDEITELSFSEMQFNLDETRRFAQAQGLTQLTPNQVIELYKITDGWAAGLQLLAFSLRKQSSPEKFLERQGKLSARQESTLNQYLEEAVAEHLTTDELDFLTRISTCRRFNVKLCEALSPDPRAAEYLAKFEQENLFLLPIDTADAEPWYRFHRLFAAFLHKKLNRFDEVERKKLNQVASHWFDGKKLHVEAMRHASLADDSDFMVDLIDRAGRRMINAANFIEYLKWYDAIPLERLKNCLNVCLCAAWALLSCSRTEEFDRVIAIIEDHKDHTKPEVNTEIVLLKAYRSLRQDDTKATLEILEPMLRAEPPSNAFHSLLMFNVASIALVYANDFERAREIARLRYRYEIPERPGYPRPLIDVIGGFSHLVQGNILLARTSLTSFIDEALNATVFAEDTAGLYSGYLLEAYYQSGEIELARSFLDRYCDLIDAVGAADGLLFSYRVRARLQCLDSQPERALETLARLEEIGYRQKLDRLIAWSLYEQVGLAIDAKISATLQDLLERLDQLSERYKTYLNCPWSEIPLAAALARADVAFYSLGDDSALEAVQVAHACATMNRRQLLSTRLGLMRAILNFNAGSKAESLDQAHALVRTASEMGMARVMIDLGAPAQPLIDSLLNSPLEERERQFLNLSSKGIGVSMHKASAPVALISSAARRGISTSSERLSTREMEVLDLLSKALSMKSIGRALNLSPGTVKWHLRNIYAKLNAASREDALAKSRAIGLIK